MVAQHCLLEPRGAVGQVGDEQHAVRHGKHAQVECLVVQHTQGEAVALGIRPARLVPTNVCGVHGDRHAAEPHAEPADGAAVLVGPERPLPECRVAVPSFS